MSRIGRLDGKVAIITGAAGGQGAAEAILFANEGAKVILTDLQEQLLAVVVNDINSRCGNVAIGFRHDVVNEQDWEYVVSEGVKRFGKVDILVNNAGIAFLDGVDSVERLGFEEWNRMLNINLIGNFLGIKKVIPEMKKAGGGSIVNISSIAGIVGGSAGPAYSSSKGANRALTKNVAIEFAKDNIRVNSVHPGYIHTPMTSSVKANLELNEAITSQIPLGFAGKPEDVAYAVLYLASNEARFVTGIELVVDGGKIAR